MSVTGVLNQLSQHPWVRGAIVDNPAAVDVVARYVAGDTIGDALKVAHTLNGHGLLGLLLPVGPHDPSATDIAAMTGVYLELIDALRSSEGDNQITVTPTLLGLRSGIASCRPQLVKVVRAAGAAGVPAVLDMAEDDLVDATLQLYREMRAEQPDVGVTLHARLHRTPDDLRAIAVDGARVRLSPGSFPMSRRVGARPGQDADLAYVRCLRQLMQSDAYPMVATHDKRLIPIAEELANLTGRMPCEYEFQLSLGFRPIEQRRLVDTGRRCRVQVPFGRDWFDYLSRRLAADPRRWLTSMVGKR